MRHPDIYIEQANSTGRIMTLRRRLHNNFVFYYPEKIQVVTTIGTNPITGKPRELLPTSLKTGRRARQAYIESMKDAGRTVKGVRTISPEMVDQLATSRFLPGDPINDKDEVIDALKEMSFILIEHMFFPKQGIIYCPKDFEDLAIGKISRAILDKRIFRAEPKDEVEEI